MKRNVTAVALALLTLAASAKQGVDPEMDKFINDLMGRMTLKERIGQLNLGGVGTPKVVGSAKGLDKAVKEGLVSSIGGFDPVGCCSRVLHHVPHSAGFFELVESRVIGGERACCRP